MKYAIGFFMVVVLSGVVYFFIVKNARPIPVPTVVEQIPVPPPRVEPNAVVVIGQRPSTTVSVSLAKLVIPGFVVIHEDAAGQLGAVLGTSALLLSGENHNVSVPLATSTTNGQKLHAVMYADTNRDRTYTAGTDMVIKSSVGEPLDAWFNISLTASTGTPLSL